MKRKIDFNSKKEITKSDPVKKNFNSSRDIGEDVLKRISEDKIFFSIQEVADIIGMSYDFVAKHIRKGNIPAVKFGDSPKIDVSTLLKIINHGVNNGTN